MNEIEAILFEETNVKLNAILHPDWDAEEWAEQIPERLRGIWSKLSPESQMVARIVGGRGVQPSRDSTPFE